MALSTRQSISEPFLTEPEQEYNILTYLSISQLRLSRLVSHTWYLMIKQLPWDDIFKRDPERQSYFTPILIELIRKKQYEQIYRWLNNGTGLKLSVRYPSTIRREYSWLKAASGYFENPTVLTVAANLLNGKEGLQVVSSLLFHNADPTQVSQSCGFQSGYSEYSSPLEMDEKELPSESACDNRIKVLLLLAEIESEIDKEQISIAFISARLEKLSDERTEFTKEYFEQLMLQRSADFSILGISRVLTQRDKTILLNIHEFNVFYRSIYHPPFYKNLLLPVTATFFGGCYSVGIFYPFSIMLGKSILSLLAISATPACALLVGSIVIGLMSGFASILFKKVWDNFHYTPFNSLHERKPSLTQTSFNTLRGGLFFKPAPAKYAEIPDHGTKLHSGPVRLWSFDSSSEQNKGVRSNNVYRL